MVKLKMRKLLVFDSVNKYYGIVSDTKSLKNRGGIRHSIDFTDEDKAGREALRISRSKLIPIYYVWNGYTYKPRKRVKYD
jgi:hypothetical protein